ncbi:cytochrome c oxidase assembly protein COX18, mitochondrial-like [Watersipora subatra]|uniref:cytochrome c oxidase assembly protein COX18, mitochondrial-like n=1 Tax=Watersipora subatra TaxID=2589382 RepID=UPI00355C6786
MSVINLKRFSRVFSYRIVASPKTNSNIQVYVQGSASVNVCKRCQSTFLQTVDASLQLGSANPLYQATSGLFEFVHTTTALPWWSSVIITTFCLRTVFILPLMVAAQRKQARLENLKTEMRAELTAVIDAMEKEKVDSQWTPREYHRIRKARMKQLSQDFYSKHNVHPLHSLVIMTTQLPLIVLVSLSLRNMAGYFGEPCLEGFTAEGGVWFSDLTMADPLFILPIFLGISNLLSMRLSKLTHPALSSLEAQSVRMEKRVRLTMTLLAVLIVQISASQPSALSLYWLSTVSYTILQNLALSVPSVRRGLGIEKTSRDPDIARLFSRRT